MAVVMTFTSAKSKNNRLALNIYEQQNRDKATRCQGHV